VRGERRYRAKAEETLRVLLGADSDVLVSAGSVFVNGTRVTDAGIALCDGDEVVVGTARAEERCVVLGEIAGLCGVDKPPALPSEPDRAGNASARTALAHALGIDESQLHAVGRLDVGVSGVMLFARSREENERAATLRDEGAIHRRYVGIALRAPEPKAGRWQSNVDGKTASTDYVTLALAGEVHANGELVRPALLSLSPLTGRKHQLRIHAAGANAPLLGDRAHGGTQRIATTNGRVIQASRVALHAERVTIADEQVVAPIPLDLRELWERLGGRRSDWELVGDESLS
jgi:tRNA pseudouridine32 synthase / 23S rRNA pseudouridine746 synthase